MGAAFFVTQNSDRMDIAEKQRGGSMTQGHTGVTPENAAFLYAATEESRVQLRARGQDFMVWGAAIALAYLGTFAMLKGYWVTNLFVLWCVCVVAPWLFSLRGVIVARLGAFVPVQTNPLTLAMRKLWIATALAQVALAASGGFDAMMPAGWFAPVSAAVLGIDFYVTGWLCDLAWLRRVAWGWWAGAVLLFMLLGHVEQSLAGAALMVALLIGPGIRLVKSKP